MVSITGHGPRVRWRRLVLPTLAAVLLAGELPAAPLPAPYPTPTPVGPLPDPVATPGTLDNLPAPLPTPLTTPTPNEEEVADAGGRLPGDATPYEYVLVEDTPENRRWFRDERYTIEGWEEGVREWEEVQRDAMGPRLAIATGGYIAAQLGAEALGKALPYLRNVYLVGKKAVTTGSLEETLHESVRAVFRVGGGLAGGAAAGAGGVSSVLIVPARIIGTTVGAGVAEVIIWTGVTLGDATRYAYDHTRSGAQQTVDWLKDKLSWDTGPPPPLPPPGDALPGPTPGRLPTPTPTPGDDAPDEDNDNNNDNGAAEETDPGGDPAGKKPGGGGGPSNQPGGGPATGQPPGQAGGGAGPVRGPQLPPLPPVRIDRPAGWGT